MQSGELGGLVAITWNRGVDELEVCARFEVGVCMPVQGARLAVLYPK